VAVLLTVILQVVILYLPFLGEFFHTVPLTLGEITLCFALAAVIYLSVEIEKYLRFRIRRRLNRNETP
jgi:Ca2+-transporting ATPase